jgi:flagellar motor switch protein FliN/FliY
MILDRGVQTLRIQLGKTWVRQRDIARIKVGSTVELDRRTDEGMEVYLNGRLIARGEPVVVNGNLGVRVVEVIDPGAVTASAATE